MSTIYYKEVYKSLFYCFIIGGKYEMQQLFSLYAYLTPNMKFALDIINN